MPSSFASESDSAETGPTASGLDGTAVALGVVTALLNLAVVLALYDRYGYPVPDGVAYAAFVATLLAFGFLPGFVTGNTRLIVPVAGFLALLSAVVFAEVTTPTAGWHELGGYPVADGPIYIGRWANNLYAVVALLLAGGVAEFGVRAGYDVAATRLRNLPALPLSRYVVAFLAGGFGSLVGAALALVAATRGVTPAGIELLVFAAGTLVVFVPLAALLYRGLLAPLALSVLVVPYPLVSELLVGSDSPVFLLLLGPLGVGLAVVATVEYHLRYRRGGGRSENRFTDANHHPDERA